MTKLTSSQRKRASLMSESSSVSTLGKLMLTTSDQTERSVIEWAIYLSMESRRVTPTLGYTGRNFNKA